MAHSRREPRTCLPPSGFRRAFALGVAMTAGLVSTSCAKQVDVKQAVQVSDVGTGWFDAGVVDGKNKLVPSLTFRLHTSAEDLSSSSVALNIVFKFADNGEDYEEIFKQRVPFQNGQTELLTVRSQTGYTGEPPQTRAEMLKNSNFRDMEAVIFVRQPAAQWVELHRVRLDRQLLTN
jgi:hypothetical protein